MGLNFICPLNYIIFSPLNSPPKIKRGLKFGGLMGLNETPMGYKNLSIKGLILGVPPSMNMLY